MTAGPEAYSRLYHVRWADMDFNAHMRNTAYLDLAGDTRMHFFEQAGFPMRELERLRLGPVILRDEVDYFRELHLLDEVRVTLRLAGLSEDRSRFRLCNEFFAVDGRRVARVHSLGGWLDLVARRLTPPPPALVAALEELPRSEDYAAIERVSE